MTRYSAELRAAVGRLLAGRRARYGELRLFAEVLKVGPRTLQKWRAQAALSEPVRMGRPRRAESERASAAAAVERAWRSQGLSSGRPRVMAALLTRGERHSAHVVRGLLCELKAQNAREVAERRRREARHVRVLAREAMWSVDATYFGDDGVQPVVGLAVKDCATTTSIAQSVGGPPRGADVIALLKQARKRRGALPHVVVMDNGPENNNEEVRAWLEEHGVTVLWNVPHTPEHNAYAESFNGELKEELRARGELWERGADPSQWHGSLAEAGVLSMRAHFARCVPRVAGILNERVRVSRGGLTARQLDRIRPRAEDLVSRDRFKKTARAAIEVAVLGIEDSRARRRAEREAILCTLEQLGLVTRTRGPWPATPSKAERLS